MLVATKFGRVGIYNEELPFINSHNPLISVLARSREMLDLLYFSYKNAYGHQTWQDCYI